MKQECTENTSNKIIVFQENRSKLTILNKSQIETSKVTIDGCEITNGLRCDYMLLGEGIEYFIELKGQDIQHAIKQLITTINKLSADSKNMTKTSFVICTRSPISSASIQNLQVKFKKNFSSKLIIRSSPFTHTL
jgi:hypothetical protein